MILARWQKPALEWPFNQLNQMRDEINRVFDSPSVGFSRLPFFNTWAPVLDVYEDRDHVVVKFELPGMKKEEIDVSLHEGVLTVSGERKLEEKYLKDETHRAERFIGRFQRSVLLPTAVA